MIGSYPELRVMKMIGLLFGVSLSLAFATSAAPFSDNTVGYVKVTVPANGFALLGVPLSGTNNLLNTTIRLPDGYDGTTAFRYDATVQNYRDAIQWIEGFGWFSPTDPAPTVNPGEGIWIRNIAANPLNFIFVGGVVQGTYSVPVPGENRLNLASSAVPRAANLGDTVTGTPPGTLGFPAADGDCVFVFDVAAQKYKDIYCYFPGFGWFSANEDDPGPLGPFIPVATGFWTQVTGPGKIWDQSFSVD